MAAKGPTISYVRGDTVSKRITVTQAGSAFDFTGLINMEIVVNSDEEPVDTSNEQFRMPVVISNPPGTDGLVDFQPAGGNVAARKTESDAYVPGEYFYDLQADDAAGERFTLFLAGAFNVLQDINKS